MIKIIKERNNLERTLISNKEDLEYNKEIYNRYGDYAHAHMITKLEAFIEPLEVEFEKFKLKYPIEDFPEVWV